MPEAVDPCSAHTLPLYEVSPRQLIPLMLTAAPVGVSVAAAVGSRVVGASVVGCTVGAGVGENVHTPQLSRQFAMMSACWAAL